MIIVSFILYNLYVDINYPSFLIFSQKRRVDKQCFFALNSDRQTDRQTDRQNKSVLLDASNLYFKGTRMFMIFMDIMRPFYVASYQ